jgi:hypothetical protein
MENGNMLRSYCGRAALPYVNWFTSAQTFFCRWVACGYIGSRTLSKQFQQNVGWFTFSQLSSVIAVCAVGHAF